MNKSINKWGKEIWDNIVPPIQHSSYDLIPTQTTLLNRPFYFGKVEPQSEILTAPNFRKTFPYLWTLPSPLMPMESAAFPFRRFSFIFLQGNAGICTIFWYIYDISCGKLCAAEMKTETTFQSQAPSIEPVLYISIHVAYKYRYLNNKNAKCHIYPSSVVGPSCSGRPLSGLSSRLGTFVPLPGILVGVSPQWLIENALPLENF